jgi:hypothetical protein
MWCLASMRGRGESLSDAIVRMDERPDSLTVRIFVTEEMFEQPSLSSNRRSTPRASA